MSINGIYQFGTLTTKSGKVINFDEIARDKDGKISQQEFIFIQKELGLDTVEFLEEDQKSEKNVTDFEFICWQQEAKMQEEFDLIINQIALDFIGDNAKYSSSAIKELRQFLNDFKADNMSDAEKMINMADRFSDELQVKYKEIKEGYISK